MDLSRRRFLIDLAFVSGMLALAAGMGTTPPPPPDVPVADEHHPNYTSITGLIGRR